jgi:Ca-activated chloride channel family protein
MISFSHILWSSPEVFWLLFPWTILAILFFRQRSKKAAQAIAVADLPPQPGKSVRQHFATALPLLLWLSGVFLIATLAGPYQEEVEEQYQGEGIQIMLSIDVSASMLAKDFEPNRLEVAKDVAASFVARRPFDQIGIAAFAGEAYTVSPLSTDPASLQQFIQELEVGQIKDGTAIGMGLATAIQRIREVESPSRIVILLTDGVNNSGYIQPRTAIEMAVKEQVKVYTIGVGTRGEAPVPYARRGESYAYRMAQVDLDENLLKEMGEKTGGRYFRAQNAAELEKIYEVIDALERTEIQVERQARELPRPQPWLALSLSCWFLFLVLYFFILKMYP